MRESYADKIAPAVSAQWQVARERGDPETNGRKEPKAGFRAHVARNLFAALPADEKAAIAARAKADAAQVKSEYKRTLQDPPSNKPADRQR
jgi:hypothetical protein